jgi:formamidopyrimidine-DNA glycosylase
MPELPEVRAQAARLDDRYRSATLQGLDTLSFTALKTVAVDPSSAVGDEVRAVSSRGKHLLLTVGEVTFVVHLMQGGRLEPSTSRAKRPKGGLARWRFADRDPLLLSEFGREHRAGIWLVVGDPTTQEPLDHLGPEADAVDGPQLAELLSGQRGRIHTVLRDQRVLAGIGRRLANEICHAARISPFAMVNKLSPDDVERVHHAIRSTIAESLAFEATQDQMVRSKDRPAAVHHRTGEACAVCGDVIRAVEYGSYTVNYCATCQTGGKVLADTTTSKFLK